MSAVEPSGLRPAGFGDVFGAAFATWWRTLAITGPATLVVLAPAYALAFAIEAATAPEALGETFFSGGDVELDAEETAAAASVVLVTAAITGIAGVVAVAVCFRGVVSGYAGALRSVGSTLSYGLARGGSAFWVAVLYGLVFLGIVVGALVAIGIASALGPIAGVAVAVVAGLAALVLLVRLAVSWSVALAVVLADDERGTRAFRRSAGLVRGRWWPTFAVLLVGGLAIAALAILVTLLLTLPFAAVESDIAALAANNVAALVAGALTTPLWTAFIAVLYYDFRGRKEGLAVEDVARTVGAERDPSEAPLAPLGGDRGRVTR